MKNIPIIGALLLMGIVFSCNSNNAEGNSDTSDSFVNKLGIAAPAAGKSEAEPPSCTDVVMEILTTSPFFKEKTKGLHEAIVSNGGTSFGIMLEGSPEVGKDDPDYSPTYDFNLHERYPDRDVVIGRFVFDPAQQQLFERDQITDKLAPIAFDKKLLEKLKQVCQ